MVSTSRLPPTLGTVTAGDSGRSLAASKAAEQAYQ